MLVAMAKSSKASDSGSVRPRTGLHWNYDDSLLNWVCALSLDVSNYEPAQMENPLSHHLGTPSPDR
jgi:hypothetical protein